MNIAEPACIPIHKVNKLESFRIHEHVIPTADLVNKPVKSVAIRNLRKRYNKVKKKLSLYTRSEISTNGAERFPVLLPALPTLI